MRMLLRGALGVLVVALSACGGGDARSTSEEALQRQADIRAVEQIEKMWHEATSNQDIDLMMSLWAPNATFTVGPGQTMTGKGEIRRFFLESPAFQPENHWLSDTPAYKMRVTVNGDRGTLYFECHYVDKTGEVVAYTAADQQVARINGRWLITNHVGASATLIP